MGSVLLKALERATKDKSLATQDFKRTRCMTRHGPNLRQKPRRYMAEILPIRHKPLSNQSIDRKHT